MILYCQNLNCDFEYIDNPTNAVVEHCPKCFGRYFVNSKAMKNTLQITTSEPLTLSNTFTWSS